MSSAVELRRANAGYAEGFGLGDLAAPPSRRLAILTCMDARIDPAQAFGLRPGEAHVMRNAGAIVTDDVLRSLAISHWELGTQEAFVVGHTRCGMATFTNDTLQRKLEGFGVDAAGVDFLPFADVEQNVRDGVRAIAESPLLPESFAVHGFVYDVATGRIADVS
jgi:carbonic anhydrase